MVRVSPPVDKFAMPMEFNMRGEEKTKSWAGFAFTLAIIGFLLFLLISGLISMFKRENMNVAITNYLYANPPKVGLKDVLMGFGVKSADGLFKKDTYFQVTVQKETIENSVTQSVSPIDFSQCDTSYFEELSKDIDINTAKEALYCIPSAQRNLYLEGSLAIDDRVQVSITFKKCSTGSSCVADGLIQAAAPQATLSLYYANPYVDPNDYDDPIKRYLFVESGKFSLASQVTKTAVMVPFDVRTDTGLLVSSTYNVSGLQIESFSSSTSTLPSDQFEYKFIFAISPKRVFYDRTYQRVQDVLAEVSGFSASLFLVVAIVISPFIKMKRSESILNAVYPNEKDREKLSIRFYDYFRAALGSKPHKAKIEEIKQKLKIIDEGLDAANIVKTYIWVEENRPLIEKLKAERGYNKDNIDNKENAAVKVSSVETPEAEEQPVPLKTIQIKVDHKDS